MTWMIINHRTDGYRRLGNRFRRCENFSLVLRGGFVGTTFLGSPGLIFHHSLATEGETTAS